MTTMTTPEQATEGVLDDGAAGEPVVSAAAAPAPTAEAPPSVADGVERRLDPCSVSLDRVIGWIVTGVLSGALLVPLLIVLFVAPLLLWAKALLALFWAVVTLAFGGFLHRWPEVAHRHASYKVDGEGIEMRQGVVWRQVINVPRSRVQHTDVSQGPLERRFGLGTLVIYTAGTDHARVDLYGLEHSTALRIRDHLLAGEGFDAV